LDLTWRGNKLYYEDAQITRKGGKGLYALASIKGKGAAKFITYLRRGNDDPNKQRFRNNP